MGDFSIRYWDRMLRRSAPVLIAIVGLSAAAWTVSLNLNAAQASSQPIPAPEITDQSPDIEITLPEYFPVADNTSISRRAELYTQIPQRSRVEVLRYTVQEGDAVFGIAEKFDITPETVLWGNIEVLNDDPHMLQPGQELNILPINGTYYQWQAGDDLETVADSFDVESQAIVEWPGNVLDPVNPVLEAGKWLVVPGGKRAFRQWLVPTIARGQAGVGTAFGPGGCSGSYTGGLVGTGGFIWPAPNHHISGNDYWSGHLAIDIAAGVGTGVWAADNGVVVFTGWSTVGYGYMVMIDHGNGWQTLYAHLSQVGVVCGQSVAQGGGIGLAGTSGASTGPHLHFETRYQGGYVSPWYVLP